MKNNAREFKGKSLTKELKNYVVIDIETTGVSPKWDKITEIGAIKVVDNIVVDEYQQLINPNIEIPSYITRITGISNSMVENAPTFEMIANQLKEFVGDFILLGHNVNFDVNFIYDNMLDCDLKLSNDFVDTLRIARKLCKDIKHHKLEDMIEYFNIDASKGRHRALADCYETLDCYNHLMAMAHNKSTTIDEIFGVAK